MASRHRQVALLLIRSQFNQFGPSVSEFHNLWLWDFFYFRIIDIVSKVNIDIDVSHLIVSDKSHKTGKTAGQAGHLPVTSQTSRLSSSGIWNADGSVLSGPGSGFSRIQIQSKASGGKPMLIPLIPQGSLTVPTQGQQRTLLIAPSDTTEKHHQHDLTAVQLQNSPSNVIS